MTQLFMEGAEVEVFRGAKHVLAENRPVVVCEMHCTENRRMLLEEFSRLGYQCVDCDEQHVLALPQ